MAVDIQASFSKKEKPRNGLEAIAEELSKDPLTRRIVIGVVECSRTVINHVDGDAETPVVRFVHIEPVLAEADVKAVRKCFERAYKARTGSHPDTPLPTMDGEQPLPEAGDGDE